jgi:hypothetical protein
MVPIYKTATGPARTAIFAFNAPAGVRCRVTFMRAQGIQLTYQMYSELETMEAWSDAAERPLFSLYITRGEISRVTLPGAEEYAFFKLPVCWLKNGINQSTFMNRTRGFRIVRNGPDALQFSYTGVDLMNSGRSTFDVTVPYERSVLSFSIKANFESLGDTTRWTSLEYCDLYPFEHVYRRDFHYRDVTFLKADGTFDRVGTGAWSGGFSNVDFPDSMGYHAVSEKREGPGTRTPSGDDGSVWILGNNAGRGNIIYRRGEWLPTPGSRSVFSLCNAWVDIHNTIVGRDPSMPRESVSYSIEVFRGTVPPLDSLNAMYRKTAGEGTVKRVVNVDYSLEGEIEGFETAK